MSGTLPPRRINRTVTIVWNSSRFDVSYGFDHDGAVREMFIASAPIAGSLLGTAYANEAVMASLLLDDLGVRAARLLERLSPEPETLTVAALARAVQLEEDEGEAIREEYAAIAFLAANTRERRGE